MFFRLSSVITSYRTAISHSVNQSICQSVHICFCPYICPTVRLLSYPAMLFPYICLTVRPSVCFACPSFVCLSFICLHYVCISFCLYIFMFVYLFVSISLCLSVCLLCVFIMFVYLCVCLSVFYLSSLCLSIFSFVRKSICFVNVDSAFVEVGEVCKWSSKF